MAIPENIVIEWVDTNPDGYVPSEGAKAIFDDIRKYSFTLDGQECFDIIYKTLIDSKVDQFTITIDRYVKYNGVFEKIKTEYVHTTNKPINISTGQRVPVEEGCVLDGDGNITGYLDGFCSVHAYYILGFRPSFESVYDGSWRRLVGIDEKY